MKSAGRQRGKVMRKRPAGHAKRQQNAKKMLNRGNELKDLLKTQDLEVSRAKNELKTNSILSAKEADQSEKAGLRIQDSGVRSRKSGVGSQDSRLTTQQRVHAKAQGTQRPQQAIGGRAGLRHQVATAGCAAIDFYVSAPGDEEHGEWGAVDKKFVTRGIRHEEFFKIERTNRECL
jgi:hypothetical protein